jgi:hypothetical protein
MLLELANSSLPLGFPPGGGATVADRRSPLWS